jgi:hypothetical protein
MKQKGEGKDHGRNNHEKKTEYSQMIHRCDWTNGVSLLETEFGNRKMNHTVVVYLSVHCTRMLKAAMIHAKCARK